MSNSVNLPLVLIRGAGDLATGVIQALCRSGFPLIVCETEKPSSIRRTVSLSEAVYDGVAAVEDCRARLCRQQAEIEEARAGGWIPLIIDPELSRITELRPTAVIDATLAKRNLGMSPALAPVTIALGPGFSAGEDCDLVIESMRGHNLGRILFRGSALPNTGVPGLIGGHDRNRVIHAPCSGRIRHLHAIGDRVLKGEEIALILTPEGKESDAAPVRSALNGILRGLIREGYDVHKGLKIADVDPRIEEISSCHTISDKARCLGGSVLEALLLLLRQKNLPPFC